MMQQKQVAVRYVDGFYTSDTRSLVVDMDYSKDEFISKGFRPTKLNSIPQTSREYIIENHPEFQRELISGTLRIDLIKGVRWSNNRGEHFDEIDYTIVRPTLPEEEYVMRQEPELTRNRTTGNFEVRINSRMMPRARDFMDFSHDPIYVIYENGPGNLRRMVLELLAEILETTAVAVLLDNRRDTRRFKRTIKELSELYGDPEEEILKRIEAKAELVRSRMGLEQKALPTYLRE